MKFYAQLNDNNICVGVSALTGTTSLENMIEISSMDSDYLWRKYENSEWSMEKFEPDSSAPFNDFNALKSKVTESEQAILELSTILGGIM